MKSPTTHDPTSGPDPTLILDTLTAFQRSAALRGAIELDLFSQIGGDQCTAAAIATACQADERAMRILCDYLVVYEFLTKQDNRYALTPTSAVFLDRKSDKFMGDMHRFINSPDLLNAFRDVAELVRQGTTQLQNRGTTDTAYAGWVDFARYMAPIIAPIAEQVGALAAELKKGPTRVLDVAAGHGMFGIRVATENPEATVVALDWDIVLEVTEENATAAGVLDRFQKLPGNAMEIDLGTGYDLVLLPNFLHHFERTTCEQFMKKVAAGLHEDGCVITVEYVPNADRVSPPPAATFAFTMLGTTPRGDAYTFEEYEAMWKTAGLHTSELRDIPNSPQAAIISRR